MRLIAGTRCCSGRREKKSPSAYLLRPDWYWPRMAAATMTAFRNRLMFSIRDELGPRGGLQRARHGSAGQEAKYVNSPETTLFRKAVSFFALDRARRAIADERRAILCEVRLTASAAIWRASQRRGLAGHGTDEDHARLLKRYAGRSPDRARRRHRRPERRVTRRRDIARRRLSIRIAALSPGEDPDSLIRKQGQAAFQRVLDGAVSALNFKPAYCARAANWERGRSGARRTRHAGTDRPCPHGRSARSAASAGG